MPLAFIDRFGSFNGRFEMIEKFFCLWILMILMAAPFDLEPGRIRIKDLKLYLACFILYSHILEIPCQVLKFKPRDTTNIVGFSFYVNIAYRMYRQ